MRDAERLSSAAQQDYTLLACFAVCERHAVCGNLILHVKVFNGSIAEELSNNTCFVPEFHALVKVAAETGSCD